jgi:hypothetical protein
LIYVARPSRRLARSADVWGGNAYAIEADSVRVVEDESGRTLHIYTAEGIIRIRLAE